MTQLTSRFSQRVSVSTISLLVLLVMGCSTNPYTQRSQLLMIPAGYENQMGEQAYQELFNDPQVTLSTNPQEVDPVKRVAARIIEAAKHSKYAESAQQFNWEISVIKDDATKNAFALPGGKIAVYTGIFPEASNEAGLAAILGHEVVHALARHGAERMSQGMLAQLGMAATAVALQTQGWSPEMNRLAMQAFGFGTQVGILLPFSRSHESEADYVGLLLAAYAGYDPQEAIRVWQRMSAASEGQPPEFMSTHPSHETRITDLQQWMAEALPIYSQAAKAPVSDLPTITPPPKSPASLHPPSRFR